MKLALRRFRHQPFGQQESGQQAWGTTALTHNASSEAKKADANETLLSWLERAAQAFMQRLVADAEPHVWYTRDAEGNLWWHAHDSVTGRSLYDASEAEMRIWLEQRHCSA
jgi:hypothetical protein